MNQMFWIRCIHRSFTVAPTPNSSEMILSVRPEVQMKHVNQQTHHNIHTDRQTLTHSLTLHFSAS